MQDVLEPQAKTGARLEPRWGQNRESSQPLPDLEEEVTSTVLVESGSAPIQGGSSSSADVPVNSSVATSASVEDMVQTSDLVSTTVGIQPASAGKVESRCFDEIKAKDFENLTNLILTSIGAKSRANLIGNVRSVSDRSQLARSLQRAFNVAWPEYRGGCRT